MFRPANTLLSCSRSKSLLPPLNARESFKSEVGVVVAMARARYKESRIERGRVDGIKGFTYADRCTRWITEFSAPLVPDLGGAPAPGMVHAGPGCGGRYLIDMGVF